MHNLEHLFTEDLKDLYSAEQQILKAMPKMIQAVSSPELKQAMEMHFKQTQKQAGRLEQVFEQMGQKASAKHCKGMEGLIKEGEELLQKKDQAEPMVLDAAIIGAAQKIEHYEIAGYGTVCTYAKLLDEEGALELLGQTLDEEKETDQRLSELAESFINVEAMQAEQSSKYKQKIASR